VTNVRFNGSEPLEATLTSGGGHPCVLRTLAFSWCARARARRPVPCDVRKRARQRPGCAAPAAHALVGRLLAAASGVRARAGGADALVRSSICVR